jgi:hypothetical protein
MSRETGWYRTIKNGLDKSNPINWEIIYYYGNINKWETGDICELDDDFTATRYVDKTPVNPMPADEVKSINVVQCDCGVTWVRVSCVI